MGDHAIQFKALQVGTWFVVEELNINEQLKTMLETGTGTKVKVRLDRNGLKITKITTIPRMGSEQKTPLEWIRHMFIDPKFPLCFFCTMRGPHGNLLKVVVIRCDKEMCATGIVNYYRTMTYKKRTSSGPKENKPANGLAAITSVEKDKIYNQTNGNVKDVEKIIPPAKTTEADAVTTAQDVAVAAIENKTEKSKDIKKLSEEVNEIQQQTLKKHPATISRQEYIDAHEKVHRFATEVTKQNNRHYTMVSVQLKNPPRNQYYFVNNDGTLTPAVRKRSRTVDSSKIATNIQRPTRSSLIRRTNTENEEVRASTPPSNAKTTSETTDDQPAPVDAPVPNKTDVTATEPIYAQVVKRRVATADPVNEEANNPTEDTSILPPVPPRTVKFDNWSIHVQNGSTKKKVPRAKVRPNSFHQVQQAHPITTYVPKPIEKVYHNSTHRISTWKHQNGHRPRINSNTFNDGKQLYVVHKRELQI